MTVLRHRFEALSWTKECASMPFPRTFQSNNSELVISTTHRFSFVYVPGRLVELQPVRSLTQLLRLLLKSVKLLR